MQEESLYDRRIVPDSRGFISDCGIAHRASVHFAGEDSYWRDLARRSVLRRIYYGWGTDNTIHPGYYLCFLDYETWVRIR